MSDGLMLSALAMVELARRHPDELETLITALHAGNPSDEEFDPEAADAWVPVDRFDRPLVLNAPILTAAGERGHVVRFDRNSGRALVEIEDGVDGQVRTRMLRTKRLELRTGRPRRLSYANAPS
jgi:hypothetical protein